MRSYKSWLKLCGDEERKELSVKGGFIREEADPDIVSKLFFAKEDNHTQAPRWANHDHFT